MSDSTIILPPEVTPPPVATPAKAAASTVEVPPNKAIAAGSAAVGTGSLSSIIVGLVLYYLAPDTPVHIAAMWDALASSLGGVAVGFITYYVPHGALVRDQSSS